MQLKKIFLSTIFTIPLSIFATSKTVNGIQINQLNGSYYEMGQEYGKQMHKQMLKTLEILKNYYIKQKGLNYDQLIKQTKELYNRFPKDYQQIINGAANGAQISLNDEIILNGMETLVAVKPIKPKLKSGCTFASIASDNTYSKNQIVLRNYDYAKPFDEIAKMLSITTFNFKHGQKVAIIALPGQIYCPSCLNDKGLFIELNNGFASGGATVNKHQKSMLTKMLDGLRSSSNISDLDNYLNSINSDFSLIVSAADNNKTISYEYSSELGHKSNDLKNNKNFVVTNNFVGKKWAENILTKNNDYIEGSKLRRQNLLDAASTVSDMDINTAKSIMNKSIKDGGAKSPYTIYQIIYDTKTRNIYLDLEDNRGWREIKFKEIFD